jgi:hypothetical protein
VKAFKFLGPGGSTIISGAVWSLPDGRRPGRWLEVGRLRPCREGIHACRTEHLAYWIHQELYEIELSGDIVESRHKVVASRGRLLRRLEPWSAGVAEELAAWCAWRVRDTAVSLLRGEGDDVAADRLAAAATIEELLATTATVSDPEASVAATVTALAGDAAAVSATSHFGGAPFIASCAAGQAAAGSDGDQVAYDRGFATERRAQSDWLAARLELVSTPLDG